MTHLDRRVVALAMWPNRETAVGCACQVCRGQVRGGMARHLRRAVPQDPLQGKDVPAAHDEAAGEDVAQVVDADLAGREAGGLWGQRDYVLRFGQPLVGAPRRGYWYSSALASSSVLLNPPAMSSIPLGNNVAVWLHLATDMLPVTVNVPAVGS